MLCLCDAVPRIELRTKICLVIHHRELPRSSNTGLLAVKALVNSEVRIRGEGRAPLDLKDVLSSQYRTFLFYPTNDAVELDKALVMQEHSLFSSSFPMARGDRRGKFTPVILS